MASDEHERGIEPYQIIAHQTDTAKRAIQQLQKYAQGDGFDARLARASLDLLIAEASPSKPRVPSS